jgi:D-threo-aldose 1-dehydrogenase
VLVAGRYTVLDRSAAAELLPACAARGVAVIAAAVLNSGLLADPVPGAPFNYAPAPPDVLALAQRLREVCRSYGVALTAAALRFPARHPAVTATLVGARSAAEVEQNLALAATDIPEALWAALDEVVGA